MNDSSQSATRPTLGPLATYLPAPRLAAAVAVLVGLLVTLTACGDDPRVVPSASRNLAIPDDPRPIDIPLAPQELQTQADFDRLEDRYLPTMGRDRLIAVYEVLAADGEPKEPAVAVLLQRLALLHLGTSTGSERLQKVFAWADKLRLGAPDSPHSVYLLGQIKRMLLLVGSTDGTFNLDSRNKDIAVKLLADWDRLFKLAPNYVGPNGTTAAELAEQRKRLAAALESVEDPATTASNKRTEARTSSDGERQARIDLWRFEHGSKGERATLCSERDERADAGGRSELERWIDLRCAAIQGKPDIVDTLLAELGDRVSPLSRCSLLTPLQIAAKRWGRPIPERLTKALAECSRAPGVPATPTK